MKLIRPFSLTLAVLSIVYLLTACQSAKPTEAELIWETHPELAPAIATFGDGYFTPGVLLRPENPSQSYIPSFISQVTPKRTIHYGRHEASPNTIHSMVVTDSILYVAYGNHLLAYDVAQPDSLIGTLSLNDSTAPISHLLPVGKLLLATVPQSGTIYAIDVADTIPFGTQKWQHYLDLAGATSLSLFDETLYVAANHGTHPDSAYFEIYAIETLDEPAPRVLLNSPGHLFSFASTSDGTQLYFLEQTTTSLMRYDLTSHQLHLVDSCQGYANPNGYFVQHH